jgi:hypothetical protein
VESIDSLDSLSGISRIREGVRPWAITGIHEYRHGTEDPVVGAGLAVLHALRDRNMEIDAVEHAGAPAMTSAGIFLPANAVRGMRALGPDIPGPHTLEPQRHLGVEESAE